VILNYYYELAHFDSDRKEEFVDHLRRQYRQDLGFFVRLRSPEECTDAIDINWEIVNACAVRDWMRAQSLFMRLRAAESMALGKFHAAYGHCLFRAAFDDYDPDDPADDSETLSQWSVSIVERSPDSLIADLTFEFSNIGLGLVGTGDTFVDPSKFGLPSGRPQELLLDARNELEKARDQIQEFRPGLRCALARCYMGLGVYRQAASEYMLLADSAAGQLAWTGFQLPGLVARFRASAAVALALAGEDAKLRQFLKQWIEAESGEPGPRESLAQLEARCGNYELAFQELSAANAINPAHDQDWKSTLLVELGTRAAKNERVAEIVRDSIAKSPELTAFMEGLVEDHWPAFRFLNPDARASFSTATRLLFDPAFFEIGAAPAAMQAGKSLELQLRAAVFAPFADYARAKAVSLTTAPGVREPLVEFVGKPSSRQLTLGAMVRYLVEIVDPKPGIHRELRSWLKASKPTLYGALAQRKLNATIDIADLRNRATHDSISRKEAVDLYRESRRWLDESTKDR
jgi:tetratricopeptide (TPR) repeat protein